MLWQKPEKDVTRLAVLAVIAFIVLWVSSVLAQETRLDTDPGSFAEDLYRAFTAKEWGIFIGCLIMLAVWGIRLFVLPRMSSDWLPHFSYGAGVLLAIAVDLTSKVPWWKAVLNGLLVGAAASGLWSQFGKKVLPTKRKKREKKIVAPDSEESLRQSPKIIVAKELLKGNGQLDPTRAMTQEEVKKILEDEDTEPYRKAIPDDTKPSS